MMNIKTAKRLFSLLIAVCVIVCSVVLPGSAADVEYTAHYYKALELQKEYISETKGAPVFGELTHEASVGAYEMLEITIDLQAEYLNPFDPDDITVNGVFTTPSGEKMLIPAFYTIPMESKNGKTLMVYSKDWYQAAEGEEPGWRVRFSGEEIGQYSFYIEVKDSQNRTAVSKTSSFNVTPSDNSGYVVVSPTNPEYFETAGDGKLFYGSGANIAWVREPFTTNPDHLSYDYFLSRAHEEGNNMTRVWMCHYAWLEWMPDAQNYEDGKEKPHTYSYAGLGYYNQNIAEAMDRVLEMCEEYDLKMVLTLDDNDEHRTTGTYCNWEYNPYNIANGGPAADTTEYWENDEAREYYKKRLRYIVARWGYSSSLFSINLWNDCSSTKNYEIVEYLQTLYDYKNSITENFRPILMGSNYNHYTGTETDENGELYNIDAIFDYTTQHLNMNDGSKPNLTQECFSSGIDDGKYFKDSLHDTVWNEFMRGSGATMIWSHDKVDETGSYSTLTNVSKFAETLDLNKQKYTFQNIDGYVTANNIALENDPYKIVEALPLGDVTAWLVKATENEFYIDYDDSNLYLAGYNSQLYGSNKDRREYRNPPTFYINAPNGGKMIMYVGSRGSGTNNVTATVNGKTTVLGKWTGLDNEPIGYVSIDLDVGDNTVLIDNTGQDWIAVGRYYFVFNSKNEQDVIKVSSMRSETQTIAYVYNSTYNYLYNTLVGFEKEAVSDVNVLMDNFNYSNYEISMYNPTTGRFLYTIDTKAANGDLNISLPKYTSGSGDMPVSFKMNKLQDSDTAISFGVDATEMGSDLSIRGCLTGAGYRNTGGKNSKYYLIDENGIATEYSFAGERFSIPQGFVGTVVIPFSSFGGNGTMSVEDYRQLETPSFGLYLFDITEDKNNLVIRDINYADADLKTTNVALEIKGIDTLLAERNISTWGQLSYDCFSTDNFKLNLNIPYLEHDMIFSITQKDQYRVQFLDPSGRVHETVFVPADTIIPEDMIPEVPSRTGYTITGWSGQINTIITEDTVIRALYEKDTDYDFEVTSTNGVVQYPGNKTYANFEDLIRVSAESEKDGAPFSHWEIDGVKVSSSNPYAFRASGSVCLTAIYGETKKAETPGVFLNNSAILTKVTDTTFKFSMIGQSYIPEGYTLVEAGMLLAAGDKSSDSLTIANKINSGRFSIVGNASAENFVVSNKYLSMHKPAEIASTESFGWQMEISSPAASDEAISIKIDASNVSADFSVVPFFKNGDNIMLGTPYAYAYLSYDNGNTSKVIIGSEGNIPVPAGFIGEIVLPFNSLASTPQFDPSAFPLYSNLIFGATFKGLADGEFINFNDLIFREINDGSDNSSTSKQSPFFGYYESVYQNFSDATEENFSSIASTWTYGGYRPTISLTEDKRVSLICSSTTNSFMNIKGSGGYGENATGVCFYLDFSDISANRSIRITFSGKTADGSTASFYPWYGGKFYYVDSRDSQLVEKTVGGYHQWSSWLGIPAGFVGKIFIPFESFIIPEKDIEETSAEYTHKPSELIDLSVSSFNIQLNSSVNDGDEIIVDDICFLYDTSDEFKESSLNENWLENTAQNFDNATSNNIAQYATVNTGSTLTATSDGRVSASRESSSALYFSMIPNTTFSKDVSGVSFHYDASDLTPTYSTSGALENKIFRIYMAGVVDGVTYNFMPWYGKTYYFLPDSEGATLEARKVSGASQWNSWLSIKPGVSGTFYIPFDSMTPPESVLDPNSGINVDSQFCHDYRDLAGINIKHVQIMQSNLNGDSITVDNLNWIYESRFTEGTTEERFQSDFYIGSDKYTTVKIPVMSAYDNSQFMVSLTNVKMSAVRSGRAYIIVRDNENRLHTYYSDSVCVASWLNY